MDAALKGLPAIDDLVEVARAAGRADASRRTIHYWVSERLVCRPHRAGRAYRYPLVSIGQVDTLARRNRRLIGPGLIRFALFVETNTIPAEEALRIAADELTALRSAWSSEGAAMDQETLREEVASAARLRGSNSVLPRRVRMSQAQRTSAVLFLAQQMPGLEALPQTGADGEAALERALGLRSGRGGAERDVPLLDAPKDLASFDIQKARQALNSAGVAQVECARRVVELFCLWFPAIIPTLISGVPVSQVPFLDVASEWAKATTPTTYVQFFAEIIARTAELPDKKLEEMLAGIDPPAAILEMLADQPASERDAVASRLRPLQRARFEQVRGPIERSKVIEHKTGS
jgi:hypothetical protein